VKVHIIFDGPPSHESGRFVEVENDQGASIKFGEWVDRGNGSWALVFETDATTEYARLAPVIEAAAKLRSAVEALDIEPDDHVDLSFAVSEYDEAARDAGLLEDEKK
jgi:hypothetical protein